MATVLVTGTSTGIGLATAFACARGGHDVWATMRDPARAQQLQALATQEGLPVTVLPLDVDDDASVSGAVARLLASGWRSSSPASFRPPSSTKCGTPPPSPCTPTSGASWRFFAASLKQPVPPAVVGEQIRHIIERDSWQLHYPEGPDAAPFLDWRAGLSDEAWVDYHATRDDEAWYRHIARDFGVDAWPPA